MAGMAVAWLWLGCGLAVAWLWLGCGLAAASAARRLAAISLSAGGDTAAHAWLAHVYDGSAAAAYTRRSSSTASATGFSASGTLWHACGMIEARLWLGCGLALTRLRRGCCLALAGCMRLAHAGEAVRSSSAHLAQWLTTSFGCRWWYYSSARAAGVWAQGSPQQRCSLDAAARQPEPPA
jgi:hypothetical protein